ncbi:spherulation-specific family 4 protein [Dactylosporangium sp. AC04546]|uniref:spherulation-specific family 4 protein n=1 Tax=Dactylosporangium sp. AC04546 TaxID=2862460 RepID=UPI001EDF40BF|nr:spherulation-specific family 4 protein [Dactylosporangium sp. AC04546]WVK84581.1 spherulation-specific family 4 protein [Dactylosporangium sp. AC04546]
MMLLPMYVHPLVDPDAWDALCRTAERPTAIVNIHDGPGAGRDEVYAVATARLQRFGVRMLGYVDLDYGNRANGEVWCDMVGWAQYPVGGIFFDQVPSDAAGLRYVTQVVRAVRGSVVLNPGTRPLPGYAALADVVCTFEGPWESYVEAPGGRDWPNAAHLVYGVPAEQLGTATALLLSRAPHGLVTDLQAPLPYHGLPSSLRERAAAR